ncbi:MAG TPA: HNH endonuclease signature motif containing protein [Acidimicrobiia bacterium]
MKRSRINPVSDRRRKRDAVYPQRREQVWSRAGGICEFCNATAMTDVHHLAGRGGPDPHRLDNLIGLCRQCHANAHGNPRWARGVGLMNSRHAAADDLGKGL